MRQRTRLVINVLTNYGAYGVYGVANVVLVGYVIRIIGKDAFGLVTLLMSFTIVTELLGRGIGQALTKQVAGDASTGQFNRVNRFVNTSFAWLVGCGTLGAILSFVLASHIEWIARIPEGLVPEARTAMRLMGLRIFLCFPFNTFQSLLWAYQRYDLTNLARVVCIILRVLLVIAYFEFVSAGVVELVLLTVVSLVIERILWLLFSLRVNPGLRFGPSFVSSTAIRTLAGFGGLMLVIDVANLIGYEAVKWVIGFELSVKDVGAYALIATLAAFAGTMVRSIANVLTPVASRFFAIGAQDKNSQLALLSTKYAVIVAGGLCLAPVALLEPFLALWVGNAYTREYLSMIAIAGIVLLLGQWFTSTAVCLLQILTGIGKLRMPAFITLVWSISALAGVWGCLRWGGGSLISAVLAISIARVVGSIAHLIYGMHTLCSDSRDFFTTAIARPGVAGVLPCAAGVAMVVFIDLEGILPFVGAAGIVALIYAVASWLITFSSTERSRIVAEARRILYGTPSADAL